MDRLFSPVVLTGGAGYIGSVVAGLLILRGYVVRVLDNLMYGQSPLDVYQGSAGLEFVKGDIRKEEDLARVLQDAEAVIHLAAIVGDPACSNNPELATDVNKTGSEMFCRMAADKGIKRFVFASTCSNYGKMDKVDGYVDENSTLRPVSHYARLKVEVEDYLLDIYKGDCCPVILRFATAYGMSPRPRLDLTVNEFTTELALGHKLEVYGEQFWRPYCHTFDLARACLMAIEADESKVSGKAFNVGDTSENYQKKQLVELILKELPESKENVVYVKKEEDVRDYRVSFDRIKQTLGFEKTKAVSNGIREYIAAVRSGQITGTRDPVMRNSD